MREAYFSWFRISRMSRQTAVFTESRIRIIGHLENEPSLKSLKQLIEMFIGLVALHRAGPGSWWDEVVCAHTVWSTVPGKYGCSKTAGTLFPHYCYSINTGNRNRQQNQSSGLPPITLENKLLFLYSTLYFQNISFTGQIRESMGMKYACVPGFLCVIDPAALELALQDRNGPQVTARLSLSLLPAGIKRVDHHAWQYVCNFR